MKEYNIPDEYIGCEDKEIVIDEAQVQTWREGIDSVLREHGVEAAVAGVSYSPSLITYLVHVSDHVYGRQAIRFGKQVIQLETDFMLALQVGPIFCRFGELDGEILVEVPNKNRALVPLGNLLKDKGFIGQDPASLPVPLGVNSKNKERYIELIRAPHLLVGGATGTGKSVFLNSLICSLLYKNSPKDLQLLLIDPKQVEFGQYNGLPHLLAGKVITKAEECFNALEWAIKEVDRRYGLFVQMMDKGQYIVHIDEYNQAVEEKDKLSKIVIVIDEFIDFILFDEGRMLNCIQRICQKSRAAGIHLVLATQRARAASAHKTILSNMPARICFATAAREDSQSLLEFDGAEKLLGHGDFLYADWGRLKERIQGAFISTENVSKIVNYLQETYPANVDQDAKERIEKGYESEPLKKFGVEPVYIQALEAVIEHNMASISFVQRICQTGYNRAGKIIEWMEEQGFISPFTGAKSREIYITREEFERRFTSKEEEKEEKEEKVDPIAIKALKYVVEQKKASISFIQRKCAIGYNRAGCIVEWMEEMGYVSPFNGATPREVLLTKEEFIALYGEQE